VKKQCSDFKERIIYSHAKATKETERARFIIHNCRELQEKLPPFCNHCEKIIVIHQRRHQLNSDKCKNKKFAKFGLET
jgi:hypothetical protein